MGIKWSHPDWASQYAYYLRKYAESLARRRKYEQPLLESEVQREWKQYDTRPVTSVRQSEVGWEALEWECKV